MGGGGMGGGMMMSPDDFVGGTFWDGRATGWVLGDPLAEQAMGPFLNPLEQNNPNARLVCLRVRDSPYAWLFEEVWGPRSLDCVKDVDGTYERIARSIAAYERSSEVSPFSSKFDAFWDAAQGRRGGPPVQMINAMNWTRFRNLGLDDQELQGLMIFNTKGSCSACHPLMPMNASGRPLLTDFRYHNLGMPKNPANPFYDMPRMWNPDGDAWVDLGLGGFLASTAGLEDAAGVARDYTAYAAQNMGKHKTPTLRNVNRRLDDGFVKAYGHNGVFKTLPQIVHFYNCRDVPVGVPPCDLEGMPVFPPAEVEENVDRVRLGNLGLQPMEGMALIKFLETLDDGWAPPAE
jgi:cytochrome c peroxidase